MIWMCSIKAHRGSRSVRCLLFSLSSPQHVLPSHPQPEACFYSASSAKPLIRQGGSYCIRLGSLYWLPYSHQSGFVLWLWIICKGSLFSGVFSGNWKDHDKQVACDFFFFFVRPFLFDMPLSVWLCCFSENPLVTIICWPRSSWKNNVGKRLHRVLHYSERWRLWEQQRKKSGHLRQCGELEGVWKSLGGGHITWTSWESAPRYEANTHCSWVRLLRCNPIIYV